MLIFILSITALIFFLWLFIRMVAGMINPERSASYSGPIPTEKQQAENQQMMVEYMQAFPHTPVAKDYPELSKLAEVTNRYEQLNRMLESGEIDEITFQIELDKFLKTSH